MSLTWIGLNAVLAVTAPLAPSVDGSRPSAPPNTRTIFRCEIAGVRTFSDRPCGSAPATGPGTIELGPLNILESSTAAAVSSPAKAKKTSTPRTAASQRSVAAGAAAKAGACGRIQQSLRKITSKMRAGYTAKEGERLRERKKDLEEKGRAQRC